MKITTVNRTIGPTINRIDKIDFPSYQSSQLSNGLQVFSIDAGTQEVIKCEFVFLAGRTFEPKKGMSRVCASMIKEGTTSFSSKEIASKVDFYGATLNTGAGMDTANITLYCLKKHFSSIFPMVTEIIQSPTFPEEELQRYIERVKHRLEIELRKNDVLAYRKFTEEIFGPDHPYGYNSSVEVYDNIDQNDLISFHDSHYGVANAYLFVSGKLDDTVMGVIEKEASHLPSKSIKSNTIPIWTPKSAAIVHIKSQKEYQTAIRLGKHMFNRNHEDFYDFTFLSTVLGGYFGSRLMRNIREDKGYTYNIDCSLDTMLYDGYFQIGTDVTHENKQKTINEIYKEIELLKDVPIVKEELEMLQNYLLGNMLNLLDGPFNRSKLIKMLTLTQKGESHFQKGIQSIQNITPKRVQELANIYFDKDSFHEVIVGA